MSSSHTGLRIWLRCGAMGVITAGLLCLGVVSPATAGPWTFAMDVVHWPVDGVPGPLDFSTRTGARSVRGCGGGCVVA